MSDSLSLSLFRVSVCVWVWCMYVCKCMWLCVSYLGMHGPHLMAVIDYSTERLMSQTSHDPELGVGASSVCPLWLKYFCFHQLLLFPGRVPVVWMGPRTKISWRRGEFPQRGNPCICPVSFRTQGVQSTLTLVSFQSHFRSGVRKLGPVGCPPSFVIGVLLEHSCTP